MNGFHRLIAKPDRSLGRHLIWRSLLAVPFALSFLLTLVLGPATINSVHGSFAWLASLSLLAALLMLGASDGLLIPAGIATFLVFPPVAGLGFNFAPAWAHTLVASIFYGSMLASGAGALAVLVPLLRRVLRRHPAAVPIGGACIGLVALSAVAVVGPPRASAYPPIGSPRIQPANMGPIINTRQREAEPSFTADGRTMFFNCHTADICVSHLNGTWEEGQWTAPQVIAPPISSAYTEVEPWINPAGDKLYFNSTRPFAHGDSLPGLSLYVDAVGLASRAGVSLFGGLGEDDIWVSSLVNGTWSEPRNINDVPGEPHINTQYFDHCLSFSADGNEAFWTSTRPGGFGGNDIWTSRRVDGKWTEPENLGPNVNSRSSEHHSMPAPDGRSLYVTSNRPGGFGRDDIYIATRGADDKWGPLVNLGQPINGPGDDRCATWTSDLKIFLFDSDRPGGYGSKDLWWVYFRDVITQE